MTKYYLKNILLNNLSQGLQFGSRWILTIVLLKVLSIEMFAVFSFVFSISNFLVAVLPFGSAVYLINKAEDSEHGIKELAVSIEIIFFMFIGIMLSFALYFSFTLVLFVVDTKRNKILIWSASYLRCKKIHRLGLLCTCLF